MKAPDIFPKVEEVFLPRSPLLSVLAQVRFESILSIENSANLAPFQDAIRSKYPIFRAETNRAINLAGSGSIKKSTVWRFLDVSEKWKVSLTSNFLAIETLQYESRDTFLERFEEILNALATQFKPGVVTRTGIRYVDRLEGDAIGKIKELVKPELLGVLGGLSSEMEKSLSANISEAHFEMEPYRLYSRWGRLPAHGTIDPTLINPVNHVSWILDIDVSNQNQRTWDSASLSKEFKELADINYNFFRWAIKDEFLTHHGAK